MSRRKTFTTYRTSTKITHVCLLIKKLMNLQFSNKLQSFSLACLATPNKRISYPFGSKLLLLHWIDYTLTSSLSLSLLNAKLPSKVPCLCCAGNCYVYCRSLFVLLRFEYIFFFRAGNNIEPHYAATGIPLGGNAERHVT